MVALSPIGGAGWQFLDDNGNPLSGGLLYVYDAGTTNLATTYTTSAGTTPNANPVVLDSAGRVSNEIWLTTGGSFKFILKTSAGVLLWTKDNIPGIMAADALNANNVAFTGYNGSTGTVSVLGTAPGSDWIGYTPEGTAATPRTLQAKLRDTVSVKDFGAVGDGVTDDTAAIQAAFDSIGTITASGYQDISAKGVTLFFPAGRYLVTNTLYMPSNTRMQGTGFGTQFKFNPSVAGKNFLEKKNSNAGGTALNRSNFSMRFEDFYVFAARDGGTTIGRNGSSIPTINSNVNDCFNLLDCAYSSFTNVMVTDFWYGTAFNLRLSSLFAYYNYLMGCVTRDCELSVQTTSASHITDCYFSHGTAFPPAALQPSVQYSVSFDGARASAMQGGAIECYCSVALIKNNGAAHTVTGVYMEAIAGNAMMDASTLASDTGGMLLGGNSYGYTPNVLYNENITRGSIYEKSIGGTFNFGDFDEMEVEHVSTRQSPSFREGLPGYAHSPAGGTVSVSTSSFIGNTSMALARAAGTAATDNQISYNFKIRSSDKVLANIWVTCLVKAEGGEDNFEIIVSDSTNGNTRASKVITFNNGWVLYATYLKRVDNSTMTFYAKQSAGSTDPAQILSVTALRVYTNGFAPIPSAYKFPEYRTAAPTTGTWVKGDIVWNSQPSAGNPPGWVCTTSGSPGTWSSMANL